MPHGSNGNSRSAGGAALTSRKTSWVAFDKNEGIVKRQFFSATLSSTPWISEWRVADCRIPAAFQGAVFDPL